MGTFVLIMWISTYNFSTAGAGAISQEFSSQETCMYAGKSLADNAAKRKAHVLTWGCFKK